MYALNLYIAVGWMLLCASTVAQTMDSILSAPPRRLIYGRYASCALPAAMIVYGAMGLDEDGAVRKINRSTRLELKEDHPNFSSKADNFLQFSPYAATYLLQAAGIRGERSYKNQMVVTLLSTGMMALSVESLKKLTHSQRPDASAYNSFPSGHTATAFTGAELMRQQFSTQSPMLAYSGFGLAAITGGMRVYNDRHWVSDVIAGAAIGILSAKAGDWIFTSFKKRKSPHNGIAF